jgi:predicted DNA-binding protein
MPRVYVSTSMSLKPQEKELLDQLCYATGLSRSQIIRRGIELYAKEIISQKDSAKKN